jgi:hypothetical protein
MRDTDETTVSAERGGNEIKVRKGYTNGRKEFMDEYKKIIIPS